MRREPRAGGDGLADHLGRRRGVADGNDHACGRDLADELRGARSLGRQRQNLDTVTRRLLELPELIPVRWPDVLPGMRAARAVLGRDVRAFHVDAGDGALHEAVRAEGIGY